MLEQPALSKMMHTVYRDLFLSRVQAAMGAARAASGISHRGLLGEIREIVIRDPLRPLLPADIGIGTGQIISHTNQTSTQIDIVLYDKSILPPILFHESTGLFPIEAVLQTIEIKSQLTSTELRKADAAASALLELEYSHGYYDTDGIGQAQNFTKMIPTLFALDSDLAPGGISEVERYDGWRAADPPLRCICVCGRGCWGWNVSTWKDLSQPYAFGEVVAFVSVLLNSYRDTARKRGNPRLGLYVL